MILLQQSQIKTIKLNDLTNRIYNITGSQGLLYSIWSYTTTFIGSTEADCHIKDILENLDI